MPVTHSRFKSAAAQFLLWLAMFCTAAFPSACAQDSRDRQAVGRPDEYRSRNFLIHTDLAEEDAAELLQKMETMLKIISRYWGAPSRKVIECYVVDDVNLYLKQSSRKTLDEITDNRQRTGDGWKNYAWRWALCHFLVNNANYNDRFRFMGVGFLTGKRSTFSRSFGSKMEELEFEFQFFIDHLERGFDVNRCAWNWRAKFREHTETRPVVSKIKANKGWQPSGLKVIKGQRYRFATTGVWTTSEDADEVSAAGSASGVGTLIGTIYDEHKLSDEIQLGSNGTFTATGDGQLWLRCRDTWNQLRDNDGTVTVEFGSVAME